MSIETFAAGERSRRNYILVGLKRENTLVLREYVWRTDHYVVSHDHELGFEALNVRFHFAERSQELYVINARELIILEAEKFTPVFRRQRERREITHAIHNSMGAMLLLEDANEMDPTTYKITFRSLVSILHEQAPTEDDEPLDDRVFTSFMIVGKIVRCAAYSSL